MTDSMARTWAERAQAELGAARRFRELLARMQNFNTHPRILQLVEQAEQEEDRHAFWCAKMARKLGHRTGFENPQTIMPGTRMPSFWEGGESLEDTIFGGDPEKQMNALVKYLQSIGYDKFPKGLDKE